MTQAILQRLSDDGKRTIGKLTIGNVSFHTLEEPWRNNQAGISCVPAGTYNCVPHGWAENTKLKFKRVYRLENTAPRVAILIHTGNTVDDIEGCILVGTTTGKLNGKDAVLNSRTAMDHLRHLIGEKSFTLVIKGPVT